MVARSAKSADVLLDTVEAIVSSAKKQGLLVFYGWAHGSNQKTVNWNEDRGGDWEKFLECAKATEASLVYLNWAPFEEFQIDEALERLEEFIASGAKAETAPDSIPSSHDIEAYREKVGVTAVLDLAFISGDVVHIYQRFADWFQAFEDLTEVLETDSDDNKDLFPERVVDKNLVRKWAAELARHPKFGAARTGDQREFLLETIAGSEIDNLPVGDILARADSIYQFEVRPKEEERLRTDARRLREEGLNINAIAVKLGISKDRASGLLSS